MSKKIILSSILVIIWMIIIFLFSHMDSLESNNKSESIIMNIVEIVDIITNATNEERAYHHQEEFILKVNYLFRKLAHFSIYLILSLLVMNLLMQLFPNKSYLNSLINTVFCFLYAITDEYHQTFVVGRTGQFLDVFIDTVGVIVGCILFLIITKIVKRNKYE